MSDSLETNREGYLVSDTQRECTKCGVIFIKTNKMTLCHSCNSKRVISFGSPESKMWQRARDRAKKSGRVFDLLVSDIIIPDYCKYLNIELVTHKGSAGGKPNSPALDRIDNSKGYTKDNIQVISHLANQMKASASKEQIILFAKKVLKEFELS